jgi:hypothetical protein
MGKLGQSFVSIESYDTERCQGNEIAKRNYMITKRFKLMKAHCTPAPSSLEIRIPVQHGMAGQPTQQ